MTRSFGLGLVLIGLGVPRLVDAIEIAYGLDIKRDVGVLPWYIVTALGLLIMLAQWRSWREVGWPKRRALCTLATCLVIVGGVIGAVLVLGSGLVEQVRASGPATVRLAIRGLVLFAGGVGVVIASAWCPSRSSAGDRAVSG